MIRQLRLPSQTITQSSLSNALGVSQSTVSEYMRKLKHVRVVEKNGNKWTLGPNYKKYLHHWGVEERGN